MPARIRGHIVYPKAEKKEPPKEIIIAHRVCRPWRPEEDAAVRAEYHNVGSKALGEKLGRDYRAVQSRALFLRITKIRANGAVLGGL